MGSGSGPIVRKRTDQGCLVPTQQAGNLLRIVRWRATDILQNKFSIDFWLLMHFYLNAGRITA